MMIFTVIGIVVVFILALVGLGGIIYAILD